MQYSNQPGQSRANDRELEDRPEQAVESGEPGETGRSRGHVIDEKGSFLGERDLDTAAEHPGEQEVGEDYESGRHDASI